MSLLSGFIMPIVEKKHMQRFLQAVGKRITIMWKGRFYVMNKTIYLVTGAAGFLGSHVCDELLERGEQVRALVLPGDKSAVHIPPAVEIVEGNLCDVDSLETFFRISEGDESIVIHCASMVTTNAEFNQKLIDVNVGGTKNIIDKCLEHPECKKMVYVSSTGAIPEQPKGTVIRETERFTPIDEKTQAGCYSQSKAMATQEVLDACRTKNLRACVVHPSGILGPKDYAISETTGTVIKIMNGEMTVGMGGSFNLCDVRDLAHGCVAAADKGKVGECYILANREVTLKEVCGMLHDASGCKTPLLYVPLSLAYRLAVQMEKKAAKTGQKPLMTNFAVYNLDRNNAFDYSKAERELGYRTRPYAETIGDMARWLVEEGLVAGNKSGKGPASDVSVAGKAAGMPEGFTGGAAFIASVAAASSQNDLKRVLHGAGITDFSEEALAENWKNLALSQDWNEVLSILCAGDFESCARKLAAHGIKADKEEFALIHELVQSAVDAPLVEKLCRQTDIGSVMALFHENGYTAITEEFLLAVREHTLRLRDDGLLSEEDITALSGQDFFERCRKSVNLVFALGTVAGLAMNADALADPAFLVAVAGGISLML